MSFVEEGRVYSMLSLARVPKKNPLSFPAVSPNQYRCSAFKLSREVGRVDCDRYSEQRFSLKAVCALVASLF